MEPHFKAHLFICTNDRGPDGKRPSCAHKGSLELRDKVKKLCNEKGLIGVRVNSAGCLDQCERGIASVIYPQQEWRLNLNEGSAADLVAIMEKLVKT